MALFENNPKDRNGGTGETVLLGLQHTFTMFGATVLVPLLTGLSVSVALFMAGIATLFFHLITKGKMPVFLGSSFAFITPIVLATQLFGQEYALGGIVVSGLIYLIIAVLVYFVGAQRVLSFFPPIVTGPIIMVIGLDLAGTAVGQASENWWLALLAFAIVVIVNVFSKGFLHSLPVLSGLIVSYFVALVLTVFGVPLVDLTPVHDAAWFGLPDFTLAKFNFNAIMIVAPVAICTVVEHIGDVIAVSAICKRNFVADPGLYRTMIGDGIATSLSALFGGPANTTYSENTGVLALSGAHNPAIMRIAACFAILLGLVPKLSSVISSIPTAIIGGISVVLFGMIASVGVRTLVENRIDFQAPRNMIIAAAILVLGLGDATVQITENIALYGMALAAIVGILLNKLLPGAQNYSTLDPTPPGGGVSAP